MTEPKQHKNRSDLPFVFVNVAITADGKINTANRRVESFSSSRDREHMLELRMKADAVIAGARTVDLNPITMGTGGAKYRRERIRHGLAEYNLRVIVSGSGTVDLNAAIFKKRFSPIIILTTKRAGPKRLEVMRRRAQDVILCGESEINFEYALGQLRNKWNVKRLLCEGGGELNAAPTLADGRGHLKLADATHLELKSSKRIGDELFLVYRVKKETNRGSGFH